ncbi:hypothetical protein H4R18_002550 [Coemansia javaensis]|uniref:Uncharacterized protein n=1 Tax=Coemansia javaensis TaxID=2761396 RepID=A0A9W8HER8_9FUNG|nr:hypothetical protein H4R18_002550 [Coemansia javaensis]
MAPSRKLVAALVRAAQLDGLRQLQRTIRPGGASDTTSSSNSSCSSSDGGGGNAGGNSHGDPRRQLVKRPSKVFRFNELVAVYETWDRDEYDRRGMPTARLDAELIEQIKQELNEFKTHEMRVHAESRANTHIIC